MPGAAAHGAFGRLVFTEGALPAVVPVTSCSTALGSSSARRPAGGRTGGRRRRRRPAGRRRRPVAPHGLERHRRRSGPDGPRPGGAGRLEALPLSPWVSGDRSTLVVVELGIVTGRRIGGPVDVPLTGWGGVRVEHASAGRRDQTHAGSAGVADRHHRAVRARARRRAPRRSRGRAPPTRALRGRPAAPRATSPPSPGSTCRTRRSQCSRGAATASSSGGGRSTSAVRVHSSALRMRSLPPLRAPCASRPPCGAGSAPSSTRCGCRPRVAPKPCGCRSASPMTLLSCMPVPGTKTPEQLPLTGSSAASPPSRSTTLTWLSRGRPAARRRAAPTCA